MINDYIKAISAHNTAEKAHRKANNSRTLQSAMEHSIDAHDATIKATKDKDILKASEDAMKAGKGDILDDVPPLHQYASKLLQEEYDRIRKEDNDDDEE